MAASYLKDAGYQILARNYRVASGEIDLIVSKDGYLIFVEVKYRSNSRYGSPEAAVTPVKQRQDQQGSPVLYETVWI